jgi:hypothetical protein
MDNYFILSSKDGDKWAKVALNMTSVNLGTCIYIAWTQFIFPSFHHPSLTHSTCPMYLFDTITVMYIHVPVPVSVPIPVYLPG